MDVGWEFLVWSMGSTHTPPIGKMRSHLNEGNWLGSQLPSGSRTDGTCQASAAGVMMPLAGWAKRGLLSLWLRRARLAGFGHSDGNCLLLRLVSLFHFSYNIFAKRFLTRTFD